MLQRLQSQLYIILGNDHAASSSGSNQATTGTNDSHQGAVISPTSNSMMGVTKSMATTQHTGRKPPDPQVGLPYNLVKPVSLKGIDRFPIPSKTMANHHMNIANMFAIHHVLPKKVVVRKQRIRMVWQFGSSKAVVIGNIAAKHGQHGAGDQSPVSTQVVQQAHLQHWFSVQTADATNTYLVFLVT